MGAGSLSSFGLKRVITQPQIPVFLPDSSPVREDWRGSRNEENHGGRDLKGAGANENEKEDLEMVTLVVIPPSNIEVMWVCSQSEGVRYEVVYHPVGST